MQARQGQDVGGARGAEGRDGPAVQPLPVPGQQGFQQGGRVVVGEFRRVDGAEQGPEGPFGRRPGPVPDRDGQRGGVAEDAEQ